MQKDHSMASGADASRIAWLTQTLADVPETDEWLGGSEREHLGTLRFPKRRNDWRLGRWTAKKLLAAFMGLPPGFSILASVEIRAAADGAPEAWLNGSPAPAAISISHSAGVSFCAAAPSGVAIGCDLEEIQVHEPALAADYFAPREIALLEQVAAEKVPLVTTLIWSAKESTLKVLREGLRRDTRTVVVQPDLSLRRESWNPLMVVCAETLRAYPGWWSARENQVLTMAADRPMVPADLE